MHTLFFSINVLLNIIRARKGNLLINGVSMNLKMISITNFKFSEIFLRRKRILRMSGLQITLREMNNGINEQKTLEHALKTRNNRKNKMS